MVSWTNKCWSIIVKIFANWSQLILKHGEINKNNVFFKKRMRLHPVITNFQNMKLQTQMVNTARNMCSQHFREQNKVLEVEAYRED